MKTRRKKRKRKTEDEKYLTEEQFKSLMISANSLGSVPFHLLFLSGALGLRIGEAVSMERKCFKKVKENLVRVKTLKTRGHPWKNVAINNDTKALVREYLTDLPTGQRWLFRGQRGHMSVRTADRLFKKAARMAGLSEIYSFHSLRHYRGIRLWQATRDLKFVQDQLRHSSMATTEVYVHMSEEEKVEKAKKISVL